jgi:hypothetical protein
MDNLFEKKDGMFFLNEKEVPVFSDEQEAAKFLVEVIKKWAPQGLFVNEVTNSKTGKWFQASEPPWEIPSPDELVFSYRMFRGKPDSSYDVPVVELINKILPRFESLEFVEKKVICNCGCGHFVFQIPFKKLEFFAKEGRQGFMRLKEIKITEENRRKNARVDSIAKGIAINSELRAQLVANEYRGTVKVVSPEVAVMQDRRLDYGSGGGTGYYDQVRVFYRTQSELKEWCWRDRYSASNDKPWLAVNDIGEVKISEQGNKVKVDVELTNIHHGNRIVSWFFKKLKEEAIELLSEKDQAKFIDKTNKEVDRIKSQLDAMWQRKVKMFTCSGYVSYLQPAIKQLEIRPEIGVAAFLTDEQIDHQEGGDRQMRRELFVLTFDKEKAELKTEEHGYTAEGVSLAILEVGAREIVVNTRNGKETIILHS